MWQNRRVVITKDDIIFAFVGEEIVFGVEHDCGDNIRDVYFLTPQGGIGTLLCEITELLLNKDLTMTQHI